MKLTIPYEEDFLFPLAHPTVPLKPGFCIDRWNREIAEAAKQIRPEALYIGGEWRGETDFSFLEELPWLRILRISTKPVRDLAAIAELSSLDRLDVPATVRGQPNVSHLPIRQCYMDWQPSFRSILQCETLEQLELKPSFDGRYANEFKHLKNLRRLRVYSKSIEDITSICSLTNLIELKLIGCKKLLHTSELEQLSELQWLTITDCPNLDLRAIGQLRNLQILNISDCGVLPSIEPLQNLKQLRSLNFAGTTHFENGDLTPLEDLPNLSMAGFVFRRHYTHRPARWDWSELYKPGGALAPR